MARKRATRRDRGQVGHEAAVVTAQTSVSSPPDVCVVHCGRRSATHRGGPPSLKQEASLLTSGQVKGELLFTFLCVQVILFTLSGFLLTRLHMHTQSLTFQALRKTSLENRPKLNKRHRRSKPDICREHS